MAVKPIPNKQVVNRGAVNRANQTSTRNLKARGGNRRTSLPVGKDITKNYAITLKDLDTAILSHVKNVMRPKIREANEMVDVTVMYGNEERWKSARKRGVMRDQNGSFILPLIMLKRTGMEKSDNIPLYHHDVKRENVQVVRHASWSKKNRYDRFSVQNNMNPIEEQLVTTVPNFVNVTYEFVLWTSFIEQMNYLVESFSEQSETYWGDSTDYKFLSTVDSIEDATELSVDTERLVKSNFNLTTKAYLLPEETNSVVTNKMSQVQKKTTVSRVSFGYEGNASNFQVKK